MSIVKYIEWTEWLPLQALKARQISDGPGLYRIRRIGQERWDYLGQTGMGLRRRLSMLRGVYAPEMPYSDPHTAAPALWAIRHQSGCDFEFSVARIEGTTPCV